ncbi:hypothetical protein B0H13DRAFT_1892032 [Mycena leptocephala]|nr:hypothetical protein B0H13DRAFT_1892032 [Mycena leptocephala]
MSATGDADVVSAEPRTVIIRHSPRVQLRLHDPGVTGTTLFCGAPQPISAADLVSQEPWRIQILPIEDPPPAQNRQRAKSNGCGAKLHSAAIPKCATWSGSSGSATEVVLPLDDDYVPRELRPVMSALLKECGCLRNPVGCAACGNALGALNIRCALHTDVEMEHVMYDFLPSAVSPPIPASPGSTTVTRLARVPRLRTLPPRSLWTFSTQDEEALRDDLSIGPRGSVTARSAPDSRVSNVLISNSYTRSLRHLLSTSTGSELVSDDSFLWTGRSDTFIPGRRQVQPSRF